MAFWTEEELNYLKNNYLIKTYKEIGSVVKRDYRNVHKKAKELGLNKPIKYAKIGDKFGHRTIISDPFFKKGSDGKNKCFYLVECDCDDKTQDEISASQLKSKPGACIECKRRKTVEIHFKHGHAALKNKPKSYSLWLSIKARCTDSNHHKYHRYGGRGIKLVEPYYSNYAIFCKHIHEDGYREGLQIDRRDNNGNYCRENWRFVNKIVQANNRSNNRLITVFGETKTMMEWTRDSRCVVTYSCLKTRLNKGWEPQKAITTPPIRISPKRKILGNL